MVVTAFKCEPLRAVCGRWGGASHPCPAEPSPRPRAQNGEQVVQSPASERPAETTGRAQPFAGRPLSIVDRTKLLEADVGCGTWKNRVEGIKLTIWPRLAQAEPEPIALQDHGYRVWYGDVKLRPYPPPKSDSSETRDIQPPASLGSDSVPARPIAFAPRTYRPLLQCIVPKRSRDVRPSVV